MEPDIAAAALMPHPPIVVPAVGGREVDHCRATLEACRELAGTLVALRADRLVIVTPHAPRWPHAAALYLGERLEGDLGGFGAREAEVSVPADAGLRAALLAGGGQALHGLDRRLDHGAVVPLWFLAEAGWSAPTCVLGLPAWASSHDLQQLGRALARALSATGGRTLLVASGDMSHRVTPGAPAGFHPQALSFDLACRDAIAGGRLRDVAVLDPALRELAAEDVVDPVTVVAATLGFEVHGQRVLSYEHPFGVGYLVAVLHQGAAGGGTA